jgi:CheY-like chemotaxis protein
MKRIVIVEDQADLRRLVRWSLEGEGYELLEVSNGAAAMAVLTSAKPALVLLDIMLPGGIDGLEICRRVRADPTLADMKVLLLSALAQKRDREAGAEAGADGYLVKPFSPKELISTVARLMQAEVEKRTAPAA